MAETIRAAIYRRVSTNRQVKGTSPETQLELAERIIRENGWTFVGDFYDPAVSGARESRPRWDALFELCRAGAVDVVIFGDLSRMSRDTRHSLNFEYELNQFGVRVLDAVDPNATQLARQLTYIINEQFQKIVRRNTMQGVAAVARQGYWASGKPPYGWRIVPAPDNERRKVIALNEPEAVAIRRAVELVLDEHKSCWDAADLLNAEGYRTYEGLRWTHNNLRRVLRATYLAGDYELHLPTGERGTFVYHGPEIIPLDRIQALHRYLRDTAASPRPPGRIYPLTGLVRGYCGNPYHGLYRPDCDLAQYVCRTSKPSGAERRRTCACPRLEAAWLEREVWGQVSSLLSDPERLERLAREYLKLRPTQVRSEAEQLSALDRKIAAKQRERTNVVLATAATGPEAVAGAIEQLTREIEALQQQYQQAQVWAQQNARSANLVRDVAELAATAQAALADCSPEEQRGWFKRLGIQVQIVGEPVLEQRTGRGGRHRRVGLHITGVLPWSGECPRTVPIPGVANTVAVVERGPRVQPVAMRLDARSGRWLVTELWY
jgi:site-specific DNA recombinase